MVATVSGVSVFQDVSAAFATAISAFLLDTATTGALWSTGVDDTVWMKHKKKSKKVRKRETCVIVMEDILLILNELVMGVVEMSEVDVMMQSKSKR